MSVSRNIIVLGETGVGKSSLINMLVGKDVAVTSDKATGCTFESMAYKDKRGNMYFDTVGLNEASKGTVTARESLSALVKLLKSLKDGVNLIIFVIKKGRITETMQKNYAIFVNGVCQDRVPVILAISGMELEKDPEKWYKENQVHFERNGMTFAQVISGCFAKPSENLHTALRPIQQSAYEDTKSRMREIIESGDYDQKKNFGTLLDWFRKTIRKVWNMFANWFGFRKITFLKELKRLLMSTLGLSENEAVAIANEIEG